MEDQKLEEQPQIQLDTQHEPHKHARPRIMIGVGAVVLVIIIGLVWMKWGKEIKEACVGDEVCTVELPATPTEGGTEFNVE